MALLSLPPDSAPRKVYLAPDRCPRVLVAAALLTLLLLPNPWAQAQPREPFRPGIFYFAGYVSAAYSASGPELAEHMRQTGLADAYDGVSGDPRIYRYPTFGARMGYRFSPRSSIYFETGLVFKERVDGSDAVGHQQYIYSLASDLLMISLQYGRTLPNDRHLFLVGPALYTHIAHLENEPDIGSRSLNGLLGLTAGYQLTLWRRPNGYVQVGPMIRLPLGSVQVGPYFQRNGDFRSPRSTFEPARLSNFTTVSFLLSVGFNSSP